MMLRNSASLKNYVESLTGYYRLTSRFILLLCLDPNFL